MLQVMHQMDLPEEAEVTVLFVSDHRIHRLNKEWRGMDTPTDCLSFPMQNDEPTPFDDTYLGDIVISVQTAHRQAMNYFPETPMPQALKQEIMVLFVHSLLHLMGYDHHTPEERERMASREKHVLSALFPGVDGLTER